MAISLPKCRHFDVNNGTDGLSYMYLDNSSMRMNCSPSSGQGFNPQRDVFDPYGYIRIPLSSLIFVLSIVGNTLVFVTLVQNRRMRTVTNVFLMNLSVSDLLLACLCMPFTLIPQLMRNFIFGEFLCVAVRYMQGVSVSVSCFTLLTISSERYFAICHPLRSRRWQTVSHSYRIILLIWLLAFFLMIPIATTTVLIPLRTGNHACRDVWEIRVLEIVYTVATVFFLFLLPLLVMGVAYGLIIRRLWIDIKLQELSLDDPEGNKNRFMGVARSCSDSETELRSLKNSTKTNDYNGHISLRQSNAQTNVSNRKHVIKMLFVVVLEYFVCWTPLYTINTWMIVDYWSLHHRMPNMGWGLILLLAYSSSCIHPITYCFMNRNFRKGFLSVFKCKPKRMRRVKKSTMRSHMTEDSSMPSVSHTTVNVRDTVRMDIIYNKVPES